FVHSLLVLRRKFKAQEGPCRFEGKGFTSWTKQAAPDGSFRSSYSLCTGHRGSSLSLGLRINLPRVDRFVLPIRAGGLMRCLVGQSAPQAGRDAVSGGSTLRTSNPRGPCARKFPRQRSQLPAWHARQT